MKGKENKVYLNPIDENISLSWNTRQVEGRTWDTPYVLNLFSIRLCVPVNDYINPCLVNFPSQ